MHRKYPDHIFADRTNMCPKTGKEPVFCVIGVTSLDFQWFYRMCEPVSQHKFHGLPTSRYTIAFLSKKL